MEWVQEYTKDCYQFTSEYDAENRMISLEYADSSSVLHRQEFRYRGDDLLAEQTFYENGALVETIRFVRDGMLVVQERNGSNAVTHEYTWGLNLGGGISGLLALSQGGSQYAYLYDGNGNVEAVLDASQAIVAAYRYDPFGVLLAQTGSLTQPYMFSTKWYDADTGLIHYEYRPYGPAIARWLTRDPLGEAGGMNLYAFVGNNPVNWVDPWGLYLHGQMQQQYGSGPSQGLGLASWGLSEDASLEILSNFAAGFGDALSETYVDSMSFVASRLRRDVPI